MMMNKQKSADKKTPYHHGGLREALIDASFKLVCEQGSDAFTLKDASHSAGVSVAAPYRHFSDKAELLFEVAERGFIKLTALMHKKMEGKQPGTFDAIGALGEAYIDFASTNPNLFRSMFQDREITPQVDLAALLTSNASNAALHPVIDMLDLTSDDMTSYKLLKNAPNAGIASYSLLLKNIALFLKENELDLDQTLHIATQFWATVHGTACLLIDRNFQKLMPSLSTEEMLNSFTKYYLTGLLAHQKK